MSQPALLGVGLYENKKIAFYIVKCLAPSTNPETSEFEEYTKFIIKFDDEIPLITVTPSQINGIHVYLSGNLSNLPKYIEMVIELKNHKRKAIKVDVDMSDSRSVSQAFEDNCCLVDVPPMVHSLPMCLYSRFGSTFRFTTTIVLFLLNISSLIWASSLVYQNINVAKQYIEPLIKYIVSPIQGLLGTSVDASSLDSLMGSSILYCGVKKYTTTILIKIYYLIHGFIEVTKPLIENITKTTIHPLIDLISYVIWSVTHISHPVISAISNAFHSITHWPYINTISSTFPFIQTQLSNLWNIIREIGSLCRMLIRGIMLLKDHINPSGWLWATDLTERSTLVSSCFLIMARELVSKLICLYQHYLPFLPFRFVLIVVAIIFCIIAEIPRDFLDITCIAPITED